MIPIKDAFTFINISLKKTVLDKQRILISIKSRKQDDDFVLTSYHGNYKLMNTIEQRPLDSARTLLYLHCNFK